MALCAPPFLKLVKDIISYFLVFHLVCMACLFNKDQPVFFRGRHVVIQVTEKLGRISVREIVIGSDQKCSGVSDLFRLRKVTVFRRMDVVKKP